MPEFIRLLHAIFDKFTIITLFYIWFTFLSLIRYVSFISHANSLVNVYPIWPDLSADYLSEADSLRTEKIHNLFYQIEELSNNFELYKRTIAFSIIFATLKLFEFLDKSKNIRDLLNVLSGVQTDFINVLIIFLCLLYGFQAMAHLSFGQDNYEFSTMSNSFETVF